MSFSSLVTSVKALPLDELRKESEGYLELVLATEELTHLYPILESFFGPPFKPAGVKPSRTVSDYVRNYGGIQAQQTLYYVERDGAASCAMIWPWNNGARATIKLAMGRM